MHGNDGSFDLVGISLELAQHGMGDGQIGVWREAAKKRFVVL